MTDRRIRAALWRRLVPGCVRRFIAEAKELRLRLIWGEDRP